MKLKYVSQLSDDEILEVAKKIGFKVYSSIKNVMIKRSDDIIWVENKFPKNFKFKPEYDKYILLALKDFEVGGAVNNEPIFIEYMRNKFNIKEYEFDRLNALKIKIEKELDYKNKEIKRILSESEKIKNAFQLEVEKSKELVKAKEKSKTSTLNMEY